MSERPLRVVLDLNVLEFLPSNARLRPGFELVLGKVVYAEIFRRALDGDEDRAKRACGKGTELLSRSDLIGRVHAGEFSWDATNRERRPRDGEVHPAGIIANSVEALDRFRDVNEPFPSVVKRDLVVQRDFNRYEIRWVDLLKDFAQEILARDGKGSMQINSDTQRAIQSREGREVFYHGLRWMYEGRVGRPAWKNYVLKSAGHCMRPAICRVHALMMYYTALMMAGPGVGEKKFRNNFRDQEYAFLASYTGALCTADKGLKDACSSAFGPRVKLLSKQDVFDIND